nr:reverse transcriptase domain-containing protein [Tanacetum cinerariifolium]
MMADQRTMAELLEAPTEGYEDAIVVPAILAEIFVLRHGLLNLVISKQFYDHDKEDPHAHIRWFNKITSTMRYPNVSNTSIKLILFLFSIEGAAPMWLEKEPPRSIFTWENLVSKFINQFFPPSKTINLRNEITNFEHHFDESFCEAWDRFKDLLRASPHHGFTELHQLDTFYNAINSTDQDSLNSVAGGNFLDKMPQDCLLIIESKSKVHNSRNKPVASRHPQVEPPNEISNYKKITDANIRAMQNQITNLKTELENEIHSTMHNQINNVKNELRSDMSNQTNKLRNMMAIFFQKNTASTSGSGPLPSNTNANPRGDLKEITTRSGVSDDGPPIPPPFSSLPKVVERVPEMTKDYDATEKLHSDLSFIDALLHMPKFAIMFKSLLNNIDKLFDLATTPVNENCSADILKKLYEKLGDPDKFLIPCDFPELVECLALADLELTLRVDDEAITFKVGQTLKHSYINVESINRIDVIDVACEKYVQEVLEFSEIPKSLSYEQINSTGIDDIDFDPDGDIHLLEKLLNDDLSSSPLPPVKNEDLKQVDATMTKPSIKEPPELELKDLPSHLEYAFLEGPINYPHQKDVIKLLDAELIYLISDSPWVSLVHCVPKKGGMTVIENEYNELIPTRWILGIFSNTNLPTRPRKDHLYLPLWNVCLSTYTFRFMQCSGHVPKCLSHLDKMLKRCEDTNLVLNWEKYHFMVKEGIVLDQKISKSMIEVDRAKVDVIAILPHPTSVKGAKNLTDDHLSRLENPHQDELEKKEITETFPLKTLGMIAFRGDLSTSWFADIANYHARNFIVKGMSSQQKKKFFKDVKYYF